MNDNGYGIKGNKTILILSLFMAVITIIQLARMGLIDNSGKFYNITPDNLEIVQNNNVLKNTHSMGKVALIYDESATDRLYIFENYKSFLDKYSIDYDIIYSDGEMVGTEYEFVIVIAANFDNSPVLQDVFDYIENGGTAYFAIVPVDSDSFISVSSSLGIIEKSYAKECYTIVDNKGIFGDIGEVYKFDTAIPIRYNVRLRSDCDVYFSDKNNNPLLWKRKLGSGTVYMCNCDLLSSYSSRGVTAQILYESLKEKKSKAFIYPLYSVATQVLTEFPSSNDVSSSKMLIAEGVSYDSFVEKKFWPLITALEKKYHIKTAISYVLSYSENTSGNFNYTLLSDSALQTYATEVLKSGGEVAFHGYSMRPLGLEGELETVGWFKPWKSFEVIKESFDYAQNYLKALFPNYKVTTYLPPQGRMSENVIKHFHEISKNIEVIAVPYERVYRDQINKDFVKDENGLNYFNFTTKANGIVWNTKNSLYSLGIFSAALDISEMLWEGKPPFDDFQSEIKEAYNLSANFPSIRQTTIRQGSKYVEYRNNIKFSYTESDNEINLKVDGFFKGLSFALRTKDKITNGEGYTAVKYDDDFYVITLEKSEVAIKKSGSTKQ